MQKTDSVDLLGEILYKEMGPNRPDQSGHFERHLVQVDQQPQDQLRIDTFQSQLPYGSDLTSHQPMNHWRPVDAFMQSHRKTNSSMTLPFDGSQFNLHQRTGSFADEQAELSYSPAVQTVNWNNRMAQQSPYSPFGNNEGGADGNVFEEYAMMKLDQRKPMGQRRLHQDNGYQQPRDLYQHPSFHTRQLSDTFSTHQDAYKGPENPQNQENQLALHTYGHHPTPSFDSNHDDQGLMYSHNSANSIYSPNRMVNNMHLPNLNYSNERELEATKMETFPSDLQPKYEPPEMFEQVVTTCNWGQCAIKYDNQEQLVTHILQDHVGTGKPSYVCEWNGCSRMQKPFSKRHKIQNHVRIHTGEKPFPCPVRDCGKKFSRQDGLNTHIKTHSSVKPFVCSIPTCAKAYFHSRSLRKHERTHGPALQRSQKLPESSYIPENMTPVLPQSEHYTNGYNNNGYLPTGENYKVQANSMDVNGGYLMELAALSQPGQLPSATSDTQLTYYE